MPFGNKITELRWCSTV